jgi:hypothetical protein
MIDTNNVYLLDCDTEVFLWIEKASSKALKQAGMKMAEDSSSYFEHPKWTRISRMM